MPESLTVPRAGLLTKDAVPVPLTGVAIDAEISSFCARVTVTQRYVNTESRPIEAVYVFPLDEGAAVCGFSAIIDGTLVVGEVKEREEAFKDYDEAISQGHGAYLLDEERPDVFQASVGNLPPGKDVLLKLTYVTELSIEKGALRFAIPTTVSPRYAPADDRTGVGRPDAEALNPPLAWRVPYGLELSVRATMTRPLTRVESPSHPVAIVIDGTAATITLAQRDAALDRDFVLSLEAAGLGEPRGWMERDDEGNETIAVAFAPTLAEATTPAEIIFLVDRSGSMAGPSIVEVRNALQLCLRSMIPGCFFNIAGFGSRFEKLFSKSRAYDERSLADASAFVAQMEADLGGTEILPALQAVLELPGQRSLPRQVVVLTDGEVTNTDAVIALAAEHAADARVFAFGIGASASHHLVKGLARAGRGVAEFIYPGERIEPKVVRQFGRLLSPALADVSVQWHGATVTQAPSDVPPVFADGRLLLYGFVKPRSAGASTLGATLTASSPSGPVSFDVDIDPRDAVAGRTVATLAARARIRELEEGPEWLKTRGSRQALRKQSAAAQEIIALAVRYSLVSRETSYVAVERRDTPVEGDMQLRRIPIALARGWGGVEQMLMAPAVAFRGPLDDTHDEMMPMPLQAKAGIERAAGGLDARAFAKLRNVMLPSQLQALHLPDLARRATSSWRRPAPSRDSAARTPMHALIALQHADGSWDLTRDFADAIGADLAVLQAEMPAATGSRDEIAKAWATAVAVGWLHKTASAQEPEWRYLAIKARRWLDGAAARLASGTWIDAAEQLLSS